MKKVTLLFILMFIICIVNGQEIPQKISYQGKLLENGEVVTGIKSITFTIGTWSETQSVDIDGGIYSVTLGETTPIPTSIFDETSTIELEISVEGTSLSPQTEILSVPYAYKAQMAVEAENVPTKLSELTNDVGYITSPNDDDADATNELQTLSISGSNLTISNGNTVTLSSSGLTLPYSSNYSGSSDALAITNTGTGEIVDFRIDNTSNSQEVMYLVSNGTGDVLQVESNGSGSGIQIDNNGTEAAFYISNSSASDEAIIIWNNGGQAIDIRNTTGSDEAIYIDNDTNDEGIYLDNSSDSYEALEIDNYSSYEAIEVYQYGDDDCAYFRIDNTSNSDDAVFAYTNGTGYAGYFSGDLKVTGTLSKSSGSFQIDHPLDPENKYLYHSFVESPDMMNIYNGNVELDFNGEAIVELPDYFEALNMEFRYQLTCIGGFSQVYIAEEINDNSFKIAGGISGLKVSWQVTGIRQDPFANENRIKVEVEKSDEEKGHYLHHEEYKQPLEKSIESLKEDKKEEL